MVGNVKCTCAFGAVASLIGVFSIYLLTLAPTVQGFDSAELTVGAYALGFVHPPGYPLYMMLGHLFAQIPIGDVGTRLNLMSAVFGGLTASVLFVLLFEQTHDGWASLIATFLFTTAPTFWSQAIRAEVYTLHTFLVVSVLVAAWYAYHYKQVVAHMICFIVLGIGMGHHLTAALLWVSVWTYAIWLIPTWRRITVGGTLLGLAVTAMLYLYFPWRSSQLLYVDYIRPYFGVDPGEVSGLWWLASARAFHCFLYTDFALTEIGQQTLHLGALTWETTLGFGLILGIWGWWRVHRSEPQWNRFLSVYFLLNLIAFLSYHVVDKEVMFLPMYAVGSVWVASGIVGLTGWIGTRHASFAGKPRIFVTLVLLIIIVIGVLLNWSSVSLQNNRRVYDFSAQLLRVVEPSAVIVNHWVTSSVFDYLQIVEGQRPDVTVFNIDFFLLGAQQGCGEESGANALRAWFAWLDHQVDLRPLCFVEPLPPIPAHFDWIRQGACWTVNRVQKQNGGVP